MGKRKPGGTPHLLKELNLTPSLFVAGERTGERGDELFGEICVENRGVMRFDVIARGAKGHSGVAGTGDLSEKLIALINNFELRTSMGIAARKRYEENFTMDKFESRFLNILNQVADAA